MSSDCSTELRRDSSLALVACSTCSAEGSAGSSVVTEVAVVDVRVRDGPGGAVVKVSVVVIDVTVVVMVGGPVGSVVTVKVDVNWLAAGAPPPEADVGRFPRMAGTLLSSVRRLLEKELRSAALASEVSFRLTVSWIEPNWAAEDWIS